MSDRDVSQAIFNELKTDPLIPVQGIQIRTEDGKAILSGQVSDLQTKQRAEIIASTIRGVETVVNQIEVRSNVKRSDSQLAQDIEDAWLVNASTESFEQSSDVKNGTATLRGTVQSSTEKRLAQAVASRVPGIRSINNQISIRQILPTRLPFEIKTDIKQVDEGVATLTGTVNHQKARRVAGTLALGIVGIKEVRNQIRIANPNLTDSQIAQRVRTTLALNSVVDGYEIQVQVDHGNVVLSGTVDTNLEKAYADDVATQIHTASFPSIRNLGINEKSPGRRLNQSTKSFFPACFINSSDPTA